MVRSTAKALAVEQQARSGAGSPRYGQADMGALVMLLEFCLGKLLDALQTVSVGVSCAWAS